MKSSLFALLLYIITHANLFAQYRYEDILHIPWGEEENEIGFRKAPGGQFGPNSFVIDEQNQKFILLDTQNRLIKEFDRESKALLNAIPIPSSTADDIAWYGEQHYYLLDGNVVTEYTEGIPAGQHTTSSYRRLITAIKAGAGGRTVLVVNGSQALTIDPAVPGGTIQQKAIPIANSEKMIQVLKRSSSLASVMIDNHTAFDLEKQNLGAIRYLGSTQDGQYYIYYETIEQQVPLIVSRHIDLVDSTGSIKANFQVPTTAHTYMFREFFIDAQGSLYQMISMKDGIHIIGWIIEPDIDFPDETLHYTPPEEFQGSYHYNQLEQPEFNPPDSGSRSGIFDYPTVTAGEALATAESYIDHVYTVTTANITAGRITDDNGVEVETPAWVQPGEISPVVYQWGGFYTLAGFDAGLSNDMYAGDKATTGVSAFAVGVDCSGFVSRCWKLPFHYSTRMMDDAITIAYGTWEELRPGDAIHKPGHVRLLVQHNPDGSLLAIEAAGYNWRVWYRSYTLSDLTQYTPRYYINMEGSPANVPQPNISSVIADDGTVISWWNTSETDAIGLKLYGSDGDDVWTDVLDGGLLSTDSVHAALDNLDQSPFFFRLHTVSPEDSITESLPSDSYGYHSGVQDNRILIVDGFDRYGGSGSYPLPYHSFAQTLGLAIAANNLSFATADNDAVVGGLVDLNSYDAVFWSLGDESTADETFSDTEQALVIAYLRNGGRLFISGSEIAWDLDHMGAVADKNFIHDYLKAGYLADDSDSYLATGAPGSIFEGLSINFDNGSHGVYEEDYPDVFTANGSEQVLLYEDGRIAALSFSGTVPAGTAPAQVVIMGFPFETIYSATERSDLVWDVVQYFGFEADVTAGDQLPAVFALHQNYPNPFNPATTLVFELPHTTKVSLVVYDIIGREVVRLVDAVRPGGFNEVQWFGQGAMGRQVASGIYIARLVTPEYSKSIKMVLMK
ncbi:MAG: T9SS type A sorting domain-containing protein [Candidatus Marinimicrobia bacterium]|nr:T9SS type A sorting domain-containing protein [Candidatus Neomarinimicrobiota bacterium]